MTVDLFLFGRRARFERLDHFLQLRERLLVFRGNWLLVLATGIGPLQGPEHGPRYRDRTASMVLLTNEIKVLFGLLMAGEAVQAEPIVYVLIAPLIDFRAVLVH